MARLSCQGYPPVPVVLSQLSVCAPLVLSRLTFLGIIFLVDLSGYPVLMSFPSCLVITILSLLYHGCPFRSCSGRP
jgi:hypothetical protein